MSSEFDRQNLIDIFVAEASDAMSTLTAALYPADGSVPTADQLQGQYIVAHRIRGAAALYGFNGSAQLTERLELLLEQATKIRDSDWVRAVGTMREMVQGVQSLVSAIGKGVSEDHQLVAQCLAASDGLVSSGAADPATGREAKAVTPEYLLPAIDADVLSYFAPEALEYLDTISRLVRSLQGKPNDDEAIHRLYRTVHTLKGSANTVGFHVLGDIAHPMENCLIAVQENRVQLGESLLQSVNRAVAAVRVILRRDPANFSRLMQEVPAVIDSFVRLAQGETVADGGGPAATLGTVEAASPATSNSSACPGVAAPEVFLSDDYLNPHLDPEVLSYFSPEAQEYLESLEANLLRLDKDLQNRELINQLFRTAHTLKGSAYTVGFQSVGDLIHHVEDYMGAVRDGRLQVLSGHTDLLLRAVDVVRILMRRDPNSLQATRQRFTISMAELTQLGGNAATIIPPASETARGSQPVMETPAAEKDEPTQAKAADTKNPEEREVIRVSRDRLERLLNLVGELVIGRGRLEQRLIVLERLSQQVLTYKAKLVDSVQSFEEKHAFTFPAAPAGAASEASGLGFPGLSDFGSLEFDKYDDFNILARRISEVTADITESMSQLSGSIRRAHDDMSQLQQLTLGMRDEIARARMVPVGTPFTRFRRTIREIARASGKEVSLVTSGEHTEVDTGVVERLVDPLIHLVRNAVYHGIESPADRVAKGKPASGTVYLHAAHRGNSIIIEVEDDGAGVDLTKIRAKAVKMGLIRPEQARSMTDAEAIKLMFAPGFSTADRVGDQAGRGVGLDVVKRVIEAMNGHIDVESVSGVGTKFTLDLPLTLLIATALMVRAGSERYALPLPSVREVTLPTESSLQRMGDRSIYQVGDEAIEVQSLRSILRREPSMVDSTMPIVIVRTAVGPVGLAVDELLGRQEIVIKSLGVLRPLERSYFGGATIDPEGRVILVVDPARLMTRDSKEAAALPVADGIPLLTDGSVPQEAESEETGGATILLVDDSLSIRKFVGRMLESAGYQVDTAVDGEDGLRKASAHGYRMIITDLEMPKLNGFEVIQALRSRPQTQKTPVVVMTTRAGDKHRQMALSIGASSYIAKPVEERALLQEVERWAGRAPVVRK
jgi:chemosensory pili system protein ChpA (sensor histidine kinase/response regulator)